MPTPVRLRLPSRFILESIEQCAGCEALRLYHVRGPDQKSAADTREAKAGQGGGEDEEDRKPRAEMEAVEQPRRRWRSSCTLG